MKKELHIGKLMSGAEFTVPLDLVTRTLAVIAIRGWGKTVAATVIAEEMCEAGLPWVALDPVGVWWGLRALADGSPSEYPIVVIGGQHADLPLERDAGPKIAEAILQENISCVIDLTGESKNAWRHFATEFCDHLMQRSAAVSHHVFIEEAPEFVPQKPLGEQRRSLAAIDRLVRLGRNFGYGATLISQRFATVNKDVLEQCENLLAGACVGKNDRKACEDWIAEVVEDTESEKKADQFIKSLTGLLSGTGWFWSPRWLKIFKQVQIRARKTFHPGATRTVGHSAIQVQMSDVRQFVDRFRSVIVTQPEKPLRTEIPQSNETRWQQPDPQERDRETERLREENARLRGELGAAKQVIAGMRVQFEPQYKTLHALFSDLNAVNGNGAGADRGIWEPWIQKLGGRCGRMIEALMERGQLTRAQLATLTEQSSTSGSFATNLAKLNTNGLILKEGDKISLAKV